MNPEDFIGTPGDKHQTVEKVSDDPEFKKLIESIRKKSTLILVLGFVAISIAVTFLFCVPNPPIFGILCLIFIGGYCVGDGKMSLKYIDLMVKLVSEVEKVHT